MIRVIAYIRPHRLEEVKTALGEIGITGITVSEVRGCGSSTETSDWFMGRELVIALPQRLKVEVVVEDANAEPVVEAIIAGAKTGSPGDGKIFLQRVTDVLRVRTAERGEPAL
ncbi:MAG: P-II family nitrogen regulator [Armatimonadota bacterium]|nr:P-II family nitrogen regulator [Armatimonadota bacterium]